MTCKACGLEHRGWVSCAKAKSDAAKVPPAVYFVEDVSLKDYAARFDKVVHEPETVVHTEPVGSSRHGKYKDPEARKAYRRDYMKRRRAKDGS